MTEQAQPNDDDPYRVTGAVDDVPSPRELGVGTIVFIVFVSLLAAAVGFCCTCFATVMVVVATNEPPSAFGMAPIMGGAGALLAAVLAYRALAANARKKLQ